MLLESGVKHHNPKTNCLRNINKECLFSQHWQIILLLQTCCLKAYLVEKIEPKYLKKKSFVFWS
jgi:hypothetical protein